MQFLTGVDDCLQFVTQFGKIWLCNLCFDGILNKVSTITIEFDKGQELFQ